MNLPAEVRTGLKLAVKSGRFKDEIVPVVVKTKKGEIVVDTDEHPTFGSYHGNFS